MASEALIDKGLYTASDVWSTACVIVEVFKESDAWTPTQEDLQSGSDRDIYLKVIQSEGCPFLDSDVVPEGLHLRLKACFEFDPMKRPSIATLLDTLKMFATYNL